MMAEKDAGPGEALIGALEEAVAFERGELPGARVDRVEVTARDAQVRPPPAYPAARIRALRRRLSLSQQVFAELLSASPSTVRAWEQGQREPDGTARRLLQVAERYPEALADTVYGRRIAELKQRGWPRLAAEPADEEDAQ
ncbi:MAG TPA: helix-turn-helix domain-containing protein [Longimicrobiaceae bacterium]|nr:helix-turn-helix domain-containing protein [Longimicrobiaceae bacterium]